MKKKEKEFNKAEKKQKTITKRKANIRLVLGIIIAFIVALIIGNNVFHLEEVDDSARNERVAALAEDWEQIDSDMNIFKDYDAAIEKLEKIIEEGGSENVYLTYAQCYAEKGDYDKSAEILYDYTKNIFGCINVTNNSRESYVYLLSLKEKVSPDMKKKIEEIEAETNKYIERWEEATLQLREKNYDKALEGINALLKDGAEIDVAYFIKMEILLGKGDNKEAKKTYEEYSKKYSEQINAGIIDYDTVDSTYESEIYDKVK